MFDRNSPLLGEPYPPNCAAIDCDEAPMIGVSVVRGDGPELVTGMYSFCGPHAEVEVVAWLQEMLENGPTRSLVVVLL